MLILDIYFNTFYRINIIVISYQLFNKNGKSFKLFDVQFRDHGVINDNNNHFKNTQIKTNQHDLYLVRTVL